MPEPYYFSGTNARASGQGHTGGLVNGQQVYVVTAVLKLNGETVRTWQWQYGEPQVSSVTLAVMFDSSHFAHGSTVTVEFVFLDSTGTWRQDDMQAPAKNRMISYGHRNPGEPPVGAGVPVAIFAGLNYATTLRQYDGWTGTEMLGDMVGATTVHYAGHGYTDCYDDDDDGLVYAIGNVLTPAVEGFRALQMGTGYPPFNSTATPPIHFAFLDTCYCGITNSFIRFCSPYVDGYGNWLENQAVMGFAGGVLLSELGRIAEIVYEALAAGLPAEAARTALVDADEIFFESSSHEGLLQAEDMPLYGDRFTRLKGVYVPNLDASTGWVRAL